MDITYTAPDTTCVQNQQWNFHFNDTAFSLSQDSNSKRLSNRTINLLDIGSGSKSDQEEFGRNEKAIELSSNYFDFPTRSAVRVRCPVCSIYFQCSQPLSSRSVSLYSSMSSDQSSNGADSRHGSRDEIGTDSVMNMGNLEQEFRLQHEDTNSVDGSPPREDSPILASNLAGRPLSTLSVEPGPQGLPPIENDKLQACRQTLQAAAPISYVQIKRGVHLPTFLKKTVSKGKGKEKLAVNDNKTKPTTAEEATSPTKFLPPRTPSPPRPVPKFSSANLETVQCEYSERMHDDASHPELQKAARVLCEEVHILQAARDKPDLSRRARFWKRLMRA